MHGTALDLFVDSPVYEGKTVPAFVKHLSGKGGREMRGWVDVSAVLSPSEDEIRVAILNRHPEEGFVIDVRFGPNTEVAGKIKVHEVYSDKLTDTNGFESDGGEKVRTVEKEVEFNGTYEVKEHSFQGVFVLLSP